MAVKKSELYSSIWEACNTFRGGMDASQYKDYVLAILFIKYISDKYADDPYPAIVIPEGASFSDMVKLKGTTTIGDDINKKIIGKIQEANTSLATITFADFDDSTKLGTDNEKKSKLTNLIALFEKPELDFSKNKASDDDILGDAYEFLMRHFATESGKSKGQFYTPSEVSLILALIIGITPENSTSATTAYDPTGGSGSLILKIGDVSEKNISLYLQEMDVTTAGLAKMNMILHNNPQAKIVQGNTLSNPQFEEVAGEKLQTFDYAVANPPFSMKSWTSGVNTTADPYGRFSDFGVPPEKNGDYAFLLHILKSLKSNGKGAIILPHGVLFRGNAEAKIRENIIKRGYIKGIIGLPANLFYGTGIPACIIVIDKENAAHRKGIFMIDASKGFIKDGNKNRLRDQDIHRIVDIFNKQIETPKFSRMVSVSEIEKNEYNLNIPRYIDSQEAEDIQDIAAHLLGGIPEVDVNALEAYWSVYPNMREELFKPNGRAGYVDSIFPKDQIKSAIFSHREFVLYSKMMEDKFQDWSLRTKKYLKGLDIGLKPKKVIKLISEDILSNYSSVSLIDKYDVYQHLMDYWNSVMQDDFYLISIDGWKAEYLFDAKKKEWNSDLVPKQLVIDRYFAKEKNKIQELETDKESTESTIQETIEEHSAEGGYFADFEKVNRASIQSRFREVKRDKSAIGELKVIADLFSLFEKQLRLKNDISDAENELEEWVKEKYQSLTLIEIKVLVVDNKWIQTIQAAVKGEMDRISQRLTQRINELVDRYEKPMPVLSKEVDEFEQRVAGHLNKMGFNF
ncbi:MAG: type I restriction-modification system subunit M [Bacteroidota bacterium]|nr:type I restriction-modification system subunit M [Bacteroidota bacterium]